MLYNQLCTLDHPAESPPHHCLHHRLVLLEAHQLLQIVTIDHLQPLLAKALIQVLPDACSRDVKTHFLSSDNPPSTSNPMLCPQNTNCQASVFVCYHFKLTLDSTPDFKKKENKKKMHCLQSKENAFCA